MLPALLESLPFSGLPRIVAKFQGVSIRSSPWSGALIRLRPIPCEPPYRRMLGLLCDSEPDGNGMSQAPGLRRAERMMPQADALAMLEQGFCGRLATIGDDGYPYCLPMLYVWMDGAVWLHNTSAHGHLRANVDLNANACFVVDEPDQVFAYGRFECDTGLAYASVILFGQIRVVAALLRGTDEEIHEERNRQARRFLSPSGQYHPLCRHTRADHRQTMPPARCLAAMARQRSQRDAKRSA